MVTSTVPAAARAPLPHERCPHCGNVAILEPSSTLRFVCAVCGKARAPIDDPQITRSDAEVQALAAATATRNAAVGWSAAGVVGAGLGGLTLLILLLVVVIAHPPLFADMVVISMALAPLLFAAASFGRAKSKRAAVEPLLDEGWALAARDAVSAGADAETLARTMRVSPDVAERLLIQLDVEGILRPHVVGERPLAPRVRVEGGAETEKEAEAHAAAESETEAEAAAEKARGAGTVGR